MAPYKARGFTLIELSVVLVIIGLIVGGILVGRDLISAATVRAQISQIEKYNSAVNTFRGKYGELPGDMTNATASKFGFAARGTNPGQGDGNGILEAYSSLCPTGTGISGTSAYACGWAQGTGETAMFWEDLTYANGLNVNLVEGSFKTASITNPPPAVTGSALGNYFPQGKISGTYIIATGGPGAVAAVTNLPTTSNYFGINTLQSLGVTCNVCTSSNTLGFTVYQAYSMDTKIDDGSPLLGRVQAYGYPGVLQGAASVPGNTTTCYDNGGIFPPP